MGDMTTRAGVLLWELGRGDGNGGRRLVRDARDGSGGAIGKVEGAPEDGVAAGGCDVGD